MSARGLPRRVELRDADGLALCGAVVAGALGGAALAGWWLGVDLPKSLIPSLLTMKFNTAVAVVLLAVALAVRGLGGRGRLGHVMASAALALAGVVGSQYITGIDLGIDQALVQEPPGQVGTIHPNRMSPMAVSSVISIALAILVSRSSYAARAVPVLGLTTVVVGLVNLLDLLLDAETPSILAGFTQMGLTTAVAAIALGFGVLGLLPGRGPLAVFSGDSSTARLARRLLVASVSVPVALAWLHIVTERDPTYGTAFGMPLMVVGTFVCLAVVIWHATRAARRIEHDRLVALEERDRFFDVSKDLLVTASSDGYFRRVNPAWTSVLGYDIATLTSRPFTSFIHPDDLSATAREVERQVERGESVFNFQNRYRHRDGSYRWLEWTSAASEDGSRLYAVARDITARKEEEERLRAPAIAEERRRAAARDRIMSVIETHAFGPIYQPVVDLESGAIIGFEGLTRFADGSSPAEVFATAARSGLGPALELATLAAAAMGARDLPRGAWLSLNVSPSTLADIDAVRAALGLRARPIVLEITENETITAYGPVRDAVRALGPDVRLAVDDAGAGVANFNHLVELRPDFVKIDAGLVRGVDIDLSRQAFVAGFLHFATTAGCTVIAEGIETDAELTMLLQLGVGLGQGYRLGRPAAASDWSSLRTTRRGRRQGRELQTATAHGSGRG